MPLAPCAGGRSFGHRPQPFHATIRGPLAALVARTDQKLVKLPVRAGGGLLKPFLNLAKQALQGILTCRLAALSIGRPSIGAPILGHRLAI